jgi:hypothetical protein
MSKEKIPQEENQPSQKRSRFWIFLLLGLCIFLGIIYIIWLYLQKPAIGDIRVSTVVSVKDTDKEKESKQFTGKYVSFSYPTGYEEKTHTTPVKGPVKENIFLSMKDLEGKKIAVVVEERENGQFEASPGYLMRVNKPKEYEKENISLGGYKGVIFRKNTVVFERTFYLRDESFIVTISTTSPMSAETLEQELFALIESIHFLK